MQKSRSILVTGGAGFIGSNLIELLVKDSNNRVYSLDDYSTGSPHNHIEGAEYRRGHTGDRRVLKGLTEVKPALVFHLGEYSRVEQSFADVAQVWRGNLTGTPAVLEFCRTVGAKLVYAGSSTKFCDGGVGRNQSPYAWSKASNADLVNNYGAWYCLKYAIAYFYNVYGPREIAVGNYATLIGRFKTCRRAGLPLRVVRPGTQVRNFTHVDDIVRGLALVGECGSGDDYALGADEGYSILEVARMFGGAIEWLPERAGNRQTSLLVSSRARDELGWRPERKLTDHIRDFLGGLQKPLEPCGIPVVGSVASGC